MGVYVPTLLLRSIVKNCALERIFHEGKNRCPFLNKHLPPMLKLKGENKNEATQMGPMTFFDSRISASEVTHYIGYQL